MNNDKKVMTRHSRTLILLVILVALGGTFFLLPKSWFEIPDVKPVIRDQNVAVSDVHSTSTPSVEDLAALVAQTPMDYSVRTRYGLALMAKSREKEALTEFLEAKRLAPANPVVYQNLGGYYLTVHDYKQADEMFSKGVELSPSDGKPHFYRGMALQGMGKHAEALEQFHTSVTLSPDFADGWINLAIEGTKDEPEQKVVEYAKTYEKLTSNSGLSNFVLSGAYRTWHKYDQAANYGELSVKSDPKNYVYWHNLGKIYTYSRKFDRAERALETAMTLTSKPAMIYQERAVNMLNSGKYEKAIEFYKSALAASPSSGHLHHSISRTYLKLNDLANSAKEEALFREWERTKQADKSHGN